jgi:hypothetical protein
LTIGVPQLGKGVVIVDAGGGTVDISAYRKVTTPKDESFEEIARPQCESRFGLPDNCALNVIKSKVSSKALFSSATVPMTT